MNIEKAIEFLLTQVYLSEFVSIGGLSQHPDMMNYWDWLYKKGIITKEENKIKQQEIREEEGDE